MKNVKMLEHNVYATNDAGRNFRAIACTEDGERVWRLAVEVKAGYQWDFVNGTQYATGEQAIMDCDLY